MSILDRFFQPSYEKVLSSLRSSIDSINAHGEVCSALSDAELAQTAASFRARFLAGESLDTLLPEVAARVREAAGRTLGIRHYEVQLIGGILLHQGKITEMRTGEGKTLVATIPAVLNAIPGNGVHVVTVNDYLARRDAVWMGQVYAALGFSVGVLNHESTYVYDAGHTEVDAARDAAGAYKVFYEYLRPCSRHEGYAADITYGTNNEFGFDYLRDNIEYEVANLRQRGHAYAIVDEIDSILIDEARTPLIISSPVMEKENLYEVFTNVANQLKPGEHYEVDEKHKSVTLTDAGIEAAEKMLGVDNIYTDKGIKYVHHLETAVRAKSLYTRDKEYVVRDGEVIIVDEFTGRLQPGRRWSDGLHQAVEAKEGVKLQDESRTFASITYQNYFRLYKKLAGMTGTALTSQEEFYTVYGLEVVPVPTNKPIKRIDHDDLIFQTVSGKYAAVIQKVKEVHAKGQPILIGTASIETNEELSRTLAAAGVAHMMLNAKNHEREGEIIADAGKKGAVTLATNMAGRGVDIKLGGAEATATEAEEVRALGGLYVLGTERHEARRIDNQLRGRSGRQGDPGETLFMVSMEDQLMRVFGGDRIKNLMGTFGIPEDQPIQNKMISRQLESAQSRIEGFHFDARKQVLAYDDVLNQQRQIVYDRRNKLLRGSHEEVMEILREVEEAVPEATDSIAKKASEYTREAWEDIVRRLSLQMIDILWVEHLEVMQYARSSVGLRAYGQRDPLIEYRKEGSRLFQEMQQVVLHRIAEVIPNLQSEALQREEAELKRAREAAQHAGGEKATETEPRKQQPRTVGKEPSRNELVTITDGTKEQTLKYKKAEPLIAAGHWHLK